MLMPPVSKRRPGAVVVGGGIVTWSGMNIPELSVAICGAGMIGGVHRRAAILAGADVRGVLASTPQRSEQVAGEWGVDHGYPDIDAVINSDVDVVHICTPNSSHVPYAEAALRAGKHVICEKPLGISLDEAQRVTDLAEDAGLVATIPFVYRFHPMAREMRARVHDAGFGTPNLIHGSYLQDWMLDPQATGWRIDAAAGGASRAFADIGSHWCDLAEWVTGERITRLLADTSIAVGQRPSGTVPSFSGTAGDAPLAEVRTEDSAVIMFRTDHHTSGSAVISQVAAGRKNRLWLEVDGAQHSAVFDQEHPEELWIGGDAESTMLARDPNHGSTEQRRLSELPPGHPQGYAQCFEHFVADSYAAIGSRASAQDRYPVGLPTFADGLRAARIVDGMLRSATSGQWVKI